MAEIAVNLVIGKLIPLLKDEVNLLRNVKGQLESVRKQLGMIQAYLKDADVQAEMTKTSNLKKEWVRQMREVSYQIEDAIDEYLLQVGEAQSWRQVDNKLHDKCGVVGVVRKICDLLRSVKPRHKISSKIGEIENSLERLRKNKDTFGFNPSAPESSSDDGATAHISTLHHLRRGALFIEDDQLVGVDHTKQVLSSWLREKPSTRTVISVVGEGGQGKTTIVNKVFNEQKKEKSFDCYAWITVSQLLRGEQLLKNLLERFYEESNKKNEVIEISKMDRNTLVNKLSEYLQKRNYMIVFDDVWDISFWGDVEHALPKDKGRIIITTRDRRVADYCGRYAPIQIHNMDPLKPDDAWKLFCLKAFPKGCPEDLKELSEEFVKKCNGVPLAIVALAGLLSTKNKNVLEWQMVYDSLRSKLSSDPDLSSIHQVLSESYQDLDYHLKSCLLYFGLFPEDYSIRRGRLIKLWIAEGFVENKENERQTLEEVAEDYLAELIARSLVKVADVNRYGRVERSCRVHDLMHDFILRKCGELNFCQVKKNEGSELHEWTRRLSIDTSIDDVTMKRNTANYGQVRSCFLFNIIQDMPHPVVESLFSSFKLLVRLDCQDTPLDYIPESVGKLFHLKYLNLKNTKIKTIPKSIGKLQNLETLNLRYTYVEELPLEANRLTKLRHLLVGFDMKFKGGVGNLRSLQQLRWVDVSVNGDGILSELKNLKQMRVLYIDGLNRENGKLLCNAIESMTNLCTLAVAAAGWDEDGVLDLESLTHPPQYLQRLTLCGRLENLPEWIPRLKNLIFLDLSYSGIREDPLPLLKDLSALLELRLFKSSYEGKELYFREGWFMKLKVLTIYLPSLETIKIDGGAMPHLQMFELYQRHSQTISLEVPAHIQKVMVVTRL